MSHVLRARARTAAVTAAALLLAGVAAANPASAEVPEPGLHWGFRQSFRNYVGNPGNTTPQKIAPQSPAVFEGDGSALTRPYLFPVASGAATDAENFRVSFAGGVTYRYEAHTFTIDLSDLALVVEDGAAEVLADVRVQTTDTENFTPVAENDVVIATSSTVSAHLTATELTASVSGLEISAEGAAALQGFLSAGTELDDMTLRVGLEAGQVPWTPYLSVLGESIGTDATTIEVRGYGFEYGRKEINYPGGLQGVAGPYVLLGSVVDEWRPSAGGTSSNRLSVKQIWPVEDSLYENPTMRAMGAVPFEADGSFAGELSGKASDFFDMAGTPAVYAYTRDPAIAAWESLHEISVAGRATDVPTIAALPTTVRAGLGRDVTVQAQVVGAYTYQWEQRGPAEGAEWVAVVGATTARLHLDDVPASAEGTRYRLVARNHLGTTRSTEVTLEVVEPAVVTVQPVSAKVAVGGTVRFTAAATGADSLQWQSRQGGGAWTDLAGATAATLAVPAKAVSQSGTEYRVLARNLAGDVASAAATLTVSKAKPVVKVSVKSKVTYASKPTATVTVTAPAGVVADGKVTVKAGRTVVGTGTVRAGKATVTLGTKLTPGSKKLVAEYAGNANLAAASSTAVTVKVAKATPKVTLTVPKTIKASTKAKVKVKVTATGTKPAGKVKLVLTKGSAKVKTITVKVRSGKTSTVRLPKLKKGTYRLKATYTGSSTVATKASTKHTLKVR